MTIPLQPLIVSAPFGNYWRAEGFTSTLGTYTVARRAGWLLRLWRVLSTVRYQRRMQSWVNRLGLPNPGISSLQTAKECILSVHGFNSTEWLMLVDKAADLEAVAVELNLSCPNVERRGGMLDDAQKAIRSARLPVIAKMPPVRWMDMGKPLWDMGVRCFHLCNTIPTPGGGLSGKPLMQYSLWAVNDFRKAFGNAVQIVGGGGVTSLDDVRTYRQAGADHVAIGSMLLNPLNWSEVRGWLAIRHSRYYRFLQENLW